MSGFMAEIAPLCVVGRSARGKEEDEDQAEEEAVDREEMDPAGRDQADEEADREEAGDPGNRRTQEVLPEVGRGEERRALVPPCRDDLEAGRSDDRRNREQKREVG